MADERLSAESVVPDDEFFGTCWACGEMCSYGDIASAYWERRGNLMVQHGVCKRCDGAPIDGDERG